MTIIVQIKVTLFEKTVFANNVAVQTFYYTEELKQFNYCLH